MSAVQAATTAATSFAGILSLFEVISRCLLKPEWFQSCTAKGGFVGWMQLDAANKIVSALFAIMAVAIGALGEKKLMSHTISI